jgi:hydroxymethylpyrimidine/phosphomethylpyrimidine kinase
MAPNHPAPNHPAPNHPPAQHHRRPADGAEPAVRPIPRVLSIAGTDPTGGAGVQADLKSIAAAGGYGMAVVTALVAQNTTGVRAIHSPPPEFLRAQLDAVSDDVVIDAVKIGMLFDAPTIAVVRDWLRAVRPPHVVLDPVMVAASGDRLLRDAAEQALREVVGSADLVTPNAPELAILLAEPDARTWDELVDQGRRLARRDRVHVLAKGGHLPTADARDALVDPDGGVREFVAERVPTANTHGTGCSLSAATATYRARLGSWEPAVDAAKRWLTESIAAGAELEVGRGQGPVSHMAGLWRRAGTHDVAAAVR